MGGRLAGTSAGTGAVGPSSVSTWVLCLSNTAATRPRLLTPIPSLNRDTAAAASLFTPSSRASPGSSRILNGEASRGEKVGSTTSTRLMARP